MHTARSASFVYFRNIANKFCWDNENTRSKQQQQQKKDTKKNKTKMQNVVAENVRSGRSLSISDVQQNAKSGGTLQTFVLDSDLA